MKGRWRTPGSRLLILMAGIAVTAAVLAVVSAGNAGAATTTEPVSGEIQQVLVDAPTDVWSGGTMVAGRQNLIIPRNLLMSFAAKRPTVRQALGGAPPACRGPPAASGLANWAAIAADRPSGGNVIAGDVFIQQGIEAVAAAVAFVDRANSFFRIKRQPLPREMR